MQKFQIKLVFAYLIYCVSTLLLFRFTQFEFLLFLPAILGIALIFRSSPMTGLGITLAYLSVEGAVKLLSTNAIFLRLAIDFLIIALCLATLKWKGRNHHIKSIFTSPYSALFWLHTTWVLVQFFNPFSIGLAPSIAAYKVYISSLLLYFISYNFVETKKDILKISWVFIALLVIQVIFSIYQFQVGESGLSHWSSNYIVAMGEKFTGIFFRPFGTSNIPGGGTTMIFILTPVVLGFGLRNLTYQKSILSILLLAFIFYVLFISQVRAALIKCLIGSTICLIILLIRNPKSFYQFVIMLICVFFSFSFFMNAQNEKFVVAKKRLEALSRVNRVWEHRTKGTYDSIIQIMQEQPLGLGLSRVGAASAPFKDRIENDSRYGTEWSFADNLYKALLIELGIPGLLFFISFLGAVLFRATRSVLRKTTNPEYRDLVAIQSGMLGGIIGSISGHLGSEGFLYQPESTLVWVMLGILVKSEKIVK